MHKHRFTVFFAVEKPVFEGYGAYKAAIFKSPQGGGILTIHISIKLMDKENVAGIGLDSLYRRLGIMTPSEGTLDHDAEFGTARWGNEKDIKPFIDPKFENNMLLTATERLTMNTRPKNPANARNLNFCGIGSSGSGKTRFWLTPQLLQAHSSYVVVDPKGGVLGQVGSFLQKCGYKIKVFNSIDFSKSMHYNPLSYIRNEADILKFVNALITNTKGARPDRA